MIKIYEVGGKLRDEFLGIPNNDIDYAVEASSYDEMIDYIKDSGGEIYLENPEFLTVRANFKNNPVDFVLCRKEYNHSDGRHPDKVEIGTLMDDASRRDFTVNCLYKNIETGEITDPYNGLTDIEKRIIRCVGKTEDRMFEDSLRILRAIRFAITKEMIIDYEILSLFSSDYWMNRLKNVSEERIQVELTKMFKHNSYQSMHYFVSYPLLHKACFSGKIWLQPTNKRKS